MGMIAGFHVTLEDSLMRPSNYATRDLTIHSTIPFFEPDVLDRGLGTILHVAWTVKSSYRRMKHTA